MLRELNRNAVLNLIFVTCLSIVSDISGSILLSLDYQKAEAQRGGIQVRTDQWLKVEKMTGSVSYRNLYNYANRPARVGDRLQVVSDEILTGTDSSVVLSLDTGVGSIYVAENTTIKILSFQLASDNGRIANLSIPRGKARLQVRKFTNRGSQLNIHTPAGISGVRGTDYIVSVQSSGNMLVTTLEGKVATTAQNQTELVKGGFQNRTIVGKPPSIPVRIINDASFKYSINKQTGGTERSILLVGYTNSFNTVKVNGLEQSLDFNGRFSKQLPAISNLKVNVTVETPQGKIQIYEIPIL